MFDYISNPFDLRYGKFLKADDISDLIALPPSQMQLVLDHFSCHQHPVICSFSVHHDYLYVSSPLSLAEKALNVKFKHFGSPRASTLLVRTKDKFKLPNTIASLVYDVYNIDSVRTVKSRIGSRKGRGSQPGSNVDPIILKNIYGAKAPISTLSSMSAAEFEGEEVPLGDVQAFQAHFGLPIQPFNIIGPNNGGYVGEGTLDIEYLLGVAPGVNTTMWSVAWTEFSQDLLTWTLQVQADPDPPLVHSVSWGSGESGFANYDFATMNRTNVEFMKMGLLGLSVLAASGDEGTNAQGLVCKRFDANWPASSPYVTAVGGTYLTASGEVGWSDSGGGFSNYWARPAWQAQAVSAYLAQGLSLPSPDLWNATGRALPDVAALATNFQVVSSGGVVVSESGTSASTPVFAALIALINDARLAAGKRPLGFLNPALYALPAGVGTDITSGNNKHLSCPAGFPAAKGWDAVTGLGTPLFEVLMTLA